MTRKFIYRDNANGSFKGAEWVGKVVFECMANGILEADKLFEEAEINFVVKKKDKPLGIVVTSKVGAPSLPFIGVSSEAPTYREIQALEKAKRLKELDETIARVQREADTYPRPWDLPKKVEKRVDTAAVWATIGLHAAYEQDAVKLKQDSIQVALGHAKTAQDRADALKELMKLIIRGE